MKELKSHNDTLQILDKSILLESKVSIFQYLIENLFNAERCFLNNEFENGRILLKDAQNMIQQILLNLDEKGNLESLVDETTFSTIRKIILIDPAQDPDVHYKLIEIMEQLRTNWRMGANA